MRTDRGSGRSSDGLALALRRAVGCVGVFGLAASGCLRSSIGRLDSAPTIAGDWRSESGRRVLDLSLSVRGTYVRGQAELRDPLGSTARFNVNGEYTPPAIRLRLSAHDQNLAQYVGYLDASDIIRGVLSGSDLTRDSLFFFRLLRSGFLARRPTGRGA